MTQTRPTSLFAAMLLACLLSGCSDAQDHAPPDTYPKYSAEGQAIMQRKDLTQAQKDNILLAERDFVNAPPAARSIALKLALGEVPSQEELKALGDDISQGFPNAVTFNRNLLIAALEYRNLAAIDGLLAAGADPYRSVDPTTRKTSRYWNFVYRMTAEQERGKWNEWERIYDYNYTNELLRLYIKHGGDVNYRGLLGNSPLLLNIGQMSNIDGFKILVDAGADVYRPGTYKDVSIIQELSMSGGFSAYRVVSIMMDMGKYDSEPKKYIPEILKDAESLLAPGGPYDSDETTRWVEEFKSRYRRTILKLVERTKFPVDQNSRIYRILNEAR